MSVYTVCIDAEAVGGIDQDFEAATLDEARRIADAETPAGGGYRIYLDGACVDEDVRILREARS